jgi:predicted phosphodiesterase
MTTTPQVLGVLSDVHRRIGAAAAAIELLKQRGATRFVYLGDAEDERVIDLFAGESCSLCLGNCDDDALGEYARFLGLDMHPDGSVLTVDGVEVAFTHGHLQTVVDRMVRSEPAFLLHGHTHVRCDERSGRTRIVNPGAFVRVERATVALVTPALDRVEFLEVH